MPAPSTRRSSFRRAAGVLGRLAPLLVLAALVPGCATADGSGAAPRAWVANHSFDTLPGTTVTSLSLAGPASASAVTTGSEPTGMATADGGQKVLVTNRGANTLSVVDASSSSVTTTTVGLEPQAVAVAPRLGPEGAALVANFGAGTLTPVNLKTMSRGKPIDVGAQPVAVAVAPGGTGGHGTALVANFSRGTLTPVDLGTMRAGPPIAVGGEPDAVAVGSSPFGEVAVVADFSAAVVTLVNLANDQPAATVGVGGNPTDVVVDQRLDTAYVTGGAALTPISLHTLSGQPPVVLHQVAEAVAVETAGSSAIAWVAEQSGWLVPLSLPSLRRGAGRFAGGRPTSLVISAAS